MRATGTPPLLTSDNGTLSEVRHKIEPRFGRLRAVRAPSVPGESGWRSSGSIRRGPAALTRARSSGILAPVALRPLFENLEIDWEAFTGPAVDLGPAVRRDAIGPSPSLNHIREDDLRSVSSLRILYGQALVRGLLVDSEARFFGFIATASYCLRVGDRPAALFAHLVR